MLSVSPYWSRFRRAIIQAAVHGSPKLGHAVVAGFPDDEGNAVEIVRSLPAFWNGRVYWLVDTQPDELLWMLEGAADAGRVRLVRKNSVRAFVLYTTASMVFFTHGLYSSPRPPAKAIFVNLWHGDGPKSRGNANFKQIMPSSFIISGTLLWGLNRLKSFNLSDKQLLVTGNPRIDQFDRPASDASLRTLGLDPDKPLVLWMPTYRGTNGPGLMQWDDAASLSDRLEVQRNLKEVAGLARDVGVTLAVKPHPLDADSFSQAGIRVLTNRELLNGKIGLYQLLARTAGLITDYSSVWTDYLALVRPIAFYCPDLPEYVESRGLNVSDLPSLLPGPMLERPEEFAGFFRACRDGSNVWDTQHGASVRHIGAETRTGAAQRLLRALFEPSYRAELQARQDFSTVRAELLCGDKPR